MDSTPRISPRARAAAALAAVMAIALAVAATSKAQAPQTRDLLPDVQAAVPDHIVMSAFKQRVLLGFNSAVINVGEGPLEVEGARTSASNAGMRARQIITRSDGSKYSARDVGSLRYVREPRHRYWHLDDVMSYELRTADTFDLVLRGTRRGFCLRDGATFSGFCGRGMSQLLTVTMGVGPARRSRYAPISEGQSFDVTRVPSGRYWLVSRVDPRGRFLESDGSNDASSVLVEITNTLAGRTHRVRLTSLGACPTAERCDNPQSFAK